MYTSVAIFGQILGLRESIASNLLTEDRWKMMVEGLGVTLEISLLSLLLANMFEAMLLFYMRLAGYVFFFTAGCIHGYANAKNSPTVPE